MRASRYLTWITLVVIVILVNLPKEIWSEVRGWCRDIIAPFHSVASGFGYRVAEGCSSVIDPSGKANATKKMELELATLRERIRRLESLEVENTAIRAQLGFKTNFPLRLVACEVIARGEASGWWECVIVNKGARDGISAGCAVISHEGVVGRTKAVAEHTSEVLLVTDRNSSIPAKLMRTGNFGIVNGGGVTIAGNPVIDMGMPQNPCSMDNIRSGVTIQPGDKIVTSGLGSIFPEGLQIGMVVSASLNKSGLYQIARIKPSADLARLRYVFVVLDRPVTPATSLRPGQTKQGVDGNIP
ncbi:MAG: rod shape-determining protein MreC [bacterium]